MLDLKKILIIKSMACDIFSQPHCFFLPFRHILRYNVRNRTRHASVYACAPGGSFFIIKHYFVKHSRLIFKGDL